MLPSAIGSEMPLGMISLFSNVLNSTFLKGKEWIRILEGFLFLLFRQINLKTFLSVISQITHLEFKGSFPEERQHSS